VTSTAVLICHLRPARRKARLLAQGEALALLETFAARPLDGGPLSESGGVFWVEIDAGDIEPARLRLPLLGYTTGVQTLVPVLGRQGADLRWRGVDYTLETLYEEDPALAREAAPDRRPFLGRVSGELRQIKGYRGDGSALSRRVLPAYDARMLANLAVGGGRGSALDPFAGVGGILLALARPGVALVSVDIDPWLGHGLARLSCGRHQTADARHLPFGDGSVAAIATEPLFDPEADEAVVASIAELARVLAPGGRLALICAARQSSMLGAAAGAGGLVAVLRSALDRKGTECGVFLWEKPASG
jgi:SAM-dependent methyltransferase